MHRLLVGLAVFHWACGPPGRAQRGENPRDGGVSAVLREADSLYRAGEYDSAGARFSSALARSREEGNQDAQAESLTGLGLVARQRSDFPAARELLTTALQLQQDRGTTTLLWRINNVLGLLGWDEGRYYDALERHAAAARLAESVNDTVSLAKSWNNIALVRTELGDFDEARRLLLRSLPVVRANHDQRSEGRVLVNLGMLAVRTGDPHTALGYFEEAIEPLEAAEDGDGELNRLGQLGTAYAAIGEPGRAIAHLDTALTRARAIGDLQEAASNLEHMASIYREAGDYPRALRIFEQARSLNDSLGLMDEAAFDLRSIAEIHRDLGNPALARRPVERALAIHRQVGARLEVMHDLLLLARLDQESGDRRGALERHREATAIAGALNARAPRLTVALATARMADYDSDHARVLRPLRDAATDLEEGGLDVAWEAHWLSARAWSGVGQLDSAVASARKATQAVERVRGEFRSGLLRTRYQSAREEVYRDLVAILLRQERIEEAFEAADASRGRVLLDHAAVLRSGGGSTIRELAEEERQLLRQMDTITTALDRLGRQAMRDSSWLHAEAGRLSEDLERIRGEYAMALTRADERDPGARALIGGASPSLAEVRATLEPGVVLLEYFTFDDRLVAFAVTPRGITVHTTAIESATLSTRIRVVRELTARQETPPGLQSALEALHESLLGTVRESGVLANVHTLLIVPQGELEYVPFAALRERASGRFLVEDFSVLHLPSAAALPVLAGRPEARTTEDIVFAPFPAELPATDAEARAFVRSLPGSAGRSGRHATEPAVRTALQSARIVHLATHGVLNARNPLFSRLELSRDGAGSADDGRLEVHEVNRLRLATALVFLSGCETGLGARGATGFHRGEDYATLTRAFLNAGARNVIATLWRVEDRGAGEFAARFYQELVVEGSVDRGLAALALVLARTQRRMLRDRQWAAPFFWAGFRLTGTGSAGAKSAVAVRS